LRTIPRGKTERTASKKSPVGTVAMWEVGSTRDWGWTCGREKQKTVIRDRLKDVRPRTRGGKNHGATVVGERGSGKKLSWLYAGRRKKSPAQHGSLDQHGGTKVGMKERKGGEWEKDEPLERIQQNQEDTIKFIFSPKVPEITEKKH